MKMRLLKTFVCVLSVMLAASCHKNVVDESGRVTFQIAADQFVIDQTKSNVSDFTTLPVADDFTLVIKDAASATVWSGKISEWDAATSLLAGNYTVTASYGDLEEEGFDKPYFFGAADFAVNGGETKAVSVSVSLANTVVTISCSDDFNNYYKDYTFRLTRDGSDIAVFPKGETKAAFLDAYKFSLEGTIDGKTFEPRNFVNLDAATAYKILFDVSNVGGTTINITFKDQTVPVELGDYELND